MTQSVARCAAQHHRQRGASSIRSFTILTATLLALACGGPTGPSDQRLVVRLTVSPPTIQAIWGGDEWTANWTVNVDAASEFPPDSHDVLLPFTAGPVFMDSVQSSITGLNGRLLTQVVDSEAAIRAANAGSNQLTAGGPLLQVVQAASYATPAEPPSASGLTIVVQLRDSRGTHQRLVTTSTIREQVCGYRSECIGVRSQLWVTGTSSPP